MRAVIFGFARPPTINDLCAMLGESHYLRLGIPRSENAAGIRHAFREQVKRYHPERVGPARAKVFAKLLEAYHVLSHPERRREYDRGQPQARMAPAPQSPAVSAAAGDSGDLPQVSNALRARVLFVDPLFESALARVSFDLIEAKAGEQISPQRLNVQVLLSVAEALQGGAVELTVPSCSPCRRCGGAGREGLFPCDLCDGEGLREETENLRVRVPANVGDGAQIEVPLRGLGPHNFYLCACIRVAG